MLSLNNLNYKACLLKHDPCITCITITCNWRKTLLGDGPIVLVKDAISSLCVLTQNSLQDTLNEKK